LIGGQAPNPDRFAQDFGEVERLAAAAVCGITKTPDGRMEVTAEAQRRKGRELAILLDAALAASEALVKCHRAAITNVARLLVEHGELSSDVVAAIAWEFPPEPDTR